jgi:hypothetical protein
MKGRVCSGNRGIVCRPRVRSPNRARKRSQGRGEVWWDRLALTSRISDFPDSEYWRTSIVFSQLSKREKVDLDILSANAGGGAFVPLEEVTEEHPDKHYGINVKETNQKPKSASMETSLRSGATTSQNGLLKKTFAPSQLTIIASNWGLSPAARNATNVIDRASGK